MPKDISVSDMQRLVTEVQSSLFTSNDIVPRVQQPYYTAHGSVPRALHNFKVMLTEYRMTVSQYLLERGTIPSYHPSVPQFSDFSLGSFSHFFVMGLTVASFGIGECGECSARLVTKLVEREYGDLSFVSIEFVNAKTGMEHAHQFIVGNFETVTKPVNGQMSVYEFFHSLPRKAIIGDPFLGIAFKPNAVPPVFRAYVDAYGGKTQLHEHFHFRGLGSNFLSHFLRISREVAAHLKPKLSGAQLYDLTTRIPIENTTVIASLRRETNLDFSGVRDSEYSVDALLPITSKSEWLWAFRLRDSSNNFGQFMRSSDGRALFVLGGVNIPEIQPNMGAYLFNFFQAPVVKKKKPLLKLPDSAWDVTGSPKMRRYWSTHLTRSTVNTLQNYMRVSQNAVIRLDADKTPEAIQGLGTDGLSACMCIIIVSHDRRRMALIHTDMNTDEKSIIRECEWVGAGTLYWIKGHNYSTPEQERFRLTNTTLKPRVESAIQQKGLPIKLNTDYLERASWSASISREGAIQLYSEVPKIPLGIAVPQIDYRDVIQMMNAILQPNVRSPLAVQYDGENWGAIPRLTTVASRFAQGGGLSGVDPFIQMALGQKLESYRQYVAFYRQELEIHNQEGTRCYQRGNYAEAVAAFRESIQYAKYLFDDTSLSTAYYNLASAYKGLGDYQNAASCFKKAIEIRTELWGPEDPKTKKAAARYDEVQSKLMRLGGSF